MENSGNQNQSRFLIAAVLSLVVLFGWSYLFPPKKPAVTEDANVAANSNTSQAVTPQSAPTAQPLALAPVQPQELTADNTPNRTITISSSLYEVKLDSKGAVATSWIIKKDKSPRGEFPVFADGSTGDNEKPLQLIPSAAFSPTSREVPFRLATDDPNLTAAVNERNYQVSVPDESITLADGQEKQIDFTLTDASGVEVKKSFLFRADSYVADLAIDLKKGGQPVPNTKLLIGASIGDHAINHHNFYHIESEAVAYVNDDIKRHQGGYAFTFDKDNQANLADQGSVSWAGVGDAYFAMAAIPAAPVQGVEYRASKYDVQTQPFFNSIFQWITRSAQTSETRHMVTVYMDPAAGFF